MPDTMTVAELKHYQETGKLPKRHQKKTRMEVINDVAAAAPELAEQAATAAKRNKYGAIKVEIGGIKFDSKKEAARYTELNALEEAGAITNLQVHPAYVFKHNGIRIGKYTADFQYWDDGRLVVEDVKSEPTRKKADYRLRKKMMAAFYGIDVREV